MLEVLGVDLVVLDQAIDTTTPAGRLLFHVLAAIAEFERDLIRERVVAGLRQARAQGGRVGRSRKYRVDPTVAHKKARQPVLYRSLAWWLAESRDRAQPEIPLEGWERSAGSRRGS